MSAPKGRVTLLKSGNRLAVDPAPPRVVHLLHPLLSFVSRRTLHGAELYRARDEGRPNVELTPTDIYTVDICGRLVTPFGFHHAVRETLVRAGYSVDFRNLTPPRRPEVYEPQWDKIPEWFEARPRQEELLIKVAANLCGRIACAPAFGKSTLIGILALIFPLARIDVVTRDRPVLDRLYKELVAILPTVGICTNGRKKLGRRVTCYTAGSLLHSPADSDFLFVDEADQVAADTYAEKFARYQNSRNFGFSGSFDMRNDGKDKRIEAMFGPVIFNVPYKEAVKRRLIVPVTVIWRDVRMPKNPCADLLDAEKEKRGIWTNTYRNLLVAEDARLYGEDTQVLICVRTVEHAVRLKKLLPEYELVYSPGMMNSERLLQFVRKGHISEDEPEMTRRRFDDLTRGFTSGRIKKAITTVWRAGVDFRQLQVVIRADARGGGADDVQIPGRAMRRHDESGKECGIIHDYLDQFDPGFKGKAGRRRKNYTADGYDQVFPPPPPKNSLKRFLEHD